MTIPHSRSQQISLVAIPKGGCLAGGPQAEDARHDDTVAPTQHEHRHHAELFEVLHPECSRGGNLSVLVYIWNGKMHRCGVWGILASRSDKM